MKTRTEGSTPDRRGFLKLAGLGSIASGAALVAAAGVETAEAAAPAATGQGYQETEHVKAYYASARF